MIVASFCFSTRLLALSRRVELKEISQQTISTSSVEENRENECF